MRIASLVIGTCLIYGCASPVKEAETAYTSELKELLPLKGHDPVEKNIFNNPKLKQRLIKLMGQNKFDTLVTAMYDCSPIGFNNDILYWVGYGEHNPESTGGAVLIDLLNDEIYVGFEMGDKIRLYSEADNVDKSPNKLKLWLKRRERMHLNTEPQKEDSVSEVE